MCRPANRWLTIAAALLGSLVLLAACDSGNPPERELGILDDSDLLPELSAADAEDWHWIDVPEMRCRNGSSTGFGLRRANGSNKLVILLQGGGACWDGLTCAVNPEAFGASAFASFQQGAGQTGMFDRSRSDNPLRDWNALFVPYCTGDFHGGDIVDRAVVDVGPRQDFVGSRNMREMLDIIRDDVRGAERVLLTGESAGGFGTLLSYDAVSERLAPAPVDLLDDSAPFPPSNVLLPPGRQAQFTSLWNLSTAIPDDCAACNAPDGLEHLMPYFATTYPNRQFGLLSYEDDLIIRIYFGYYGVVGPDEFWNGIVGLRDSLPANGKTYFAPGQGHVFLSTGAFYSTRAGGVPLNEWIGDFLAGTAEHAAPSSQAVGAGGTFGAR